MTFDALEERKWETPESYGGFSPVGDYCIMTQNRDSDTLERSNWICACEELKAQAYDDGEEGQQLRPAVYHWRAGHWAVGWVEYLMVRADAPEAVKQEANDLICALADYPMVNEDHLGEMEMEEASEAAGRTIPLVIENVRGAQEWVGRAAWNFGSYYLWGDIPALMPITVKSAKLPGRSHTPQPGYKSAGMNWSDRSIRGQDFTRIAGQQSAHKQPGLTGERDNGKGSRWFQDGAARSGSKSSARKQASAMIAKIPFELSRHIAAVYSEASA